MVEFVAGTLGQKVPNSATDVSGSKNVVAKKHGLEQVFGHDVKNVNYPLVPKSKSSYVPYLRLVWLSSGLPDPLPFGLAPGVSVAEITGVLGDPAGQIRSLGARRLSWERVLDPVRGVVLRVEPKSVAIQVNEARELTPRRESRPFVGLFVAWLADRGLLDAARPAGRRADGHLGSIGVADHEGRPARPPHSHPRLTP